MKVTVIPIVIGVLGTVTKGTEGLGNKRTNGDHPNYFILQIGQNTEKSPGGLEEIFCRSKSSEKPSANDFFKILKEIIIIMSYQRAEQVEELESDVDINCNWCALNSPLRLGKKTGEFRNQGKNQEHPNNLLRLTRLLRTVLDTSCHEYFCYGLKTSITLFNYKFVVCVFLDDLGRI